MTFSHPYAWFGLLLALPILFVHLRRRRPLVERVVHFPLWRMVFDAHLQSRGWRRWREAILLMLNLAALVAIVFALAGPRPTASSGGPPVWIAVLDVSPTLRAMDGSPERSGRPVSRLEQARAALRGFVDTLPGGVSVGVVTLGDSIRWECRPVADRARAVAAIEGASFGGATSGTWESIVSTIRAEAGEEAGLAIATDGAGPGALDAVLRDAGIRWFSCGRTGDNAAVVGLVVETVRGRAAATVTVRVRNSTSGARRLPLAIRGPSGTLATGTVNCPADGEATALFPISLPEPMPVEAEIESADVFSADDRAFTLALPRPPVPMLVVCREGRPDPFLQAAIGVLGAEIDASRSGTCPPDRWPRVSAEFPAGTVVCFDGTSPAGPLPPGRYLFFGSEGPDLPVRVRHRSAGGSLWRWDPSDPLWGGTDLSDLRVLGTAIFDPRGTDRVLLEGSEGPMAVAGGMSGARWIAFGFTPEQSNLPLLVAFPVFLRRAIDALAEDGSPSIARLPPGSAPSRAELGLPAGVSAEGGRVFPEKEPERRRIGPDDARFGRLETEGVYRFQAGGRVAWVSVEGGEEGGRIRPGLLPSPPKDPPASPSAASSLGLLTAIGALLLTGFEWALFHAARSA